MFALAISSKRATPNTTVDSRETGILPPKESKEIVGCQNKMAHFIFASADWLRLGSV